MNQDNTKEHKTICINRKKLIDAIVWSQDPNNYENGYRGVHVFPWWFNDGNTAQPTIQFYQSGNEYPPETAHVCEFGVMAFLDEDAFLRDASWDDLENGYNDLRKEAEEAGEDSQSWVDEADKSLREIVSNCLVSEIVCDAQYIDHETDEVRNYDHRYKVEYVEAEGEEPAAEGVSA